VLVDQAGILVDAVIYTPAGQLPVATRESWGQMPVAGTANSDLVLPVEARLSSTVVGHAAGHLRDLGDCDGFNDHESPDQKMILRRWTARLPARLPESGSSAASFRRLHREARRLRSRRPALRGAQDHLGTLDARWPPYDSSSVRSPSEVRPDPHLERCSCGPSQHRGLSIPQPAPLDSAGGPCRRVQHHGRSAAPLAMSWCGRGLRVHRAPTRLRESEVGRVPAQGTRSTP
jgi:hypothetical protein